MMFIVGLTGGIGSGKSAAAKYFLELGVTIIDADKVSREIVEPGSIALIEIADHFGQAILLADGSLDRAALRARVFADDTERRWLEQLTHPLIGQTIFDRLSATKQQGESSYRILESPLLMETVQKDLTHRLLLIDVPVETQILRTMSRDDNTEQQVRAIIDAQMPREEKLKLADDVIDNTKNLEALKYEVEKLHEHYLALGGEFFKQATQ